MTQNNKIIYFSKRRHKFNSRLRPEWFIYVNHKPYLHRQNGPAIIENSYNYRSWWYKGLIHRKDGPAYIENLKFWYYNNTNYFKQEYWNK